MNNAAEVRIWDTKIGVLFLKQGSRFASFEYDPEFVANVAGLGLELAPLTMPISRRVYEFPDLAASFHGVPGLFADSLPDKFGNAVIRNWLASRGIAESDFNVIDRLCYTGKRGMGAIEYVPSAGPDGSFDDQVSIAEMVKFASEVLKGRSDIKVDITDNDPYHQLLRLGTSAGGARAKAVIAWNEKTNEVRSGQINLGEGFEYWLLKFDGVSSNGDHGLEDVPEYTMIEYAYHMMARRAGIDMQECRMLEENGRHHFMTKRFDRVNGKKIHMQTLGALTHTDYDVPCLMGYEYAADRLKAIGITSSQIEQFYRRMVFNVLAVNQDDHVKNISVLMDRKGVWTLSPAYDITFSYSENNRWLSAHQMTINGKNKDITLEDLQTAGQRMGIHKKKINAMIEQVRDAVNDWNEIAGEVGIREKTADYIAGKIKEASV